VAIYGVVNSTSPGGFSAAVRGQNNGTGGNGIGVWGSQAGSGWGVYGTSVSGIGGNFSGGTGTGVSATGATGGSFSGTTVGVSATSSGGVGVSASGKTGVVGSGGVGVVGGGGYGGYFTGSAAALHLVPTTTAGPPTSGAHLQGDLIVDSAGILFICTASGTPGTWVKVGAQ
jgi:hypothetical protein